MAIYHADLKNFSRGLGHSSVACAAYRVGNALIDERTGITHDYSIRNGVAYFQTLLPMGSPEALRDLAVLWNAVERAEKRVDARVARELIVALPVELDAPQRQALAVSLGQMLVDRYQVALTLAVHTPDVKGDDRNHHVHLLFTTRTLGPDGFGLKTRMLDDKVTGPLEVRAIREQVAQLTNAALQFAGSTARVDHRSLDAQAEEAAERGDVEAVVRLSRPPTKHEGKAATVRKRRGERMDRVAVNEERRADAAVALRDSLRIEGGSSAESETLSVAAPVNPNRPTRHVEIVPVASRPARRSLADEPPRLRRMRLKPARSTRLASANASAHAVYLHLLQEAARDAGAIARAYIDSLKIEGDEADRLLRQSQRDATFSLLLQRINQSRVEAIAVSALPYAIAAARPTRLQCGRRPKQAHRRWAAFERRRQRLLPLHSDFRHITSCTASQSVRPQVQTAPRRKFRRS